MLQSEQIVIRLLGIAVVYQGVHHRVPNLSLVPQSSDDRKKFISPEFGGEHSHQESYALVVWHQTLFPVLFLVGMQIYLHSWRRKNRCIPRHETKGEEGHS